MPEISRVQKEVLAIKLSLDATCRTCQGGEDDCMECPLASWVATHKSWRTWRLSSVSESVLKFCHSRCGSSYPLCEYMRGDGGRSCPMFTGRVMALRGYKAKETMRNTQIP
jgi:hypothetical protein